MDPLSPPFTKRKAASYVQVLMAESKKFPTGRCQPVLSSAGPASNSSVQMNIPVDENIWLNRTWVGRLRDLPMFDRIGDNLMWTGYNGIIPKYIRDDMVLLMGLTKNRAAQMAEEVNGQRSAIFYLLEKWTPQLRTGHCLVWLLCWGIPLHAWDVKHL